MQDTTPRLVNAAGVPISSESTSALLVPESAAPKYPMYHRACRKIAFYTVVRWGPGAPMRASDVRLLDGSIPGTHSQMTCGSCGEAITARAGTINSLTYEKPVLYTRKPGKKKLVAVK